MYKKKGKLNWNAIENKIIMIELIRHEHRCQEKHFRFYYFYVQMHFLLEGMYLQTKL